MRIALFLLAGSLVFAQNLDELLERVSRYEYGQSREALSEFDAAVRAALGSPEKLKEIESRLAALLDSGATLAAKDYACRQLSLIGTDASVPALARLLAGEKTRDMARYALERIGTPAARKALPAVPRKEDETAALIRAEQLLASGDRVAAAGIYRKLAAASQPEPVRAAALRGLAAAAPSEGLKLNRQVLAKGTPRMQAAAIQALGSMAGNAATEALVEELPKLPPVAQVQAIAALAARGDAAARPALMRAASSPNGDVRAAALDGLGSLGDTSAVALLAGAAANSSGAEQAAARASLYRLRGAGIDRAVAAGIGSSSGRLKAEYVRAAGERGIASAAGALLQAARDADAGVRREAIRALRDTAGTGHLEALIEVLQAAADATERREAERTLVAVLRRAEKPPAAPLVAASRGAASAESRASLMTVMASAGLAESLPLFREALADNDAARRRAAIQALAEWPDATPAGELIEAARSDANPAHQVLALRGYLRLVALPSNRKPAETAGMLAAALKTAKQADEKRAALSALQRAPCPEALAAAESMLTDAEVAAEAKLAVSSIRKALAGRR